jgi:hypothetical protein
MKAVSSVPNKELLDSMGIDRRKSNNPSQLNESVLGEIKSLEDKLKQYDPVNDKDIVDYLLWQIDRLNDVYYNSLIYSSNIKSDDSLLIYSSYIDKDDYYSTPPLYHGSVADFY